MKKLLLATAAIALIAPAAQAEVKLDLGGYFKGYAGYSDQDTAGLRDFDIKRKSQIFFTGETTLDNGLTVGYNGQLMQDTGNETAAGAAAQVEQSYLYFSGNWGRVNLGKENGAGYLLQVAAPGADANLDGMDIDFSFFDPVAGAFRQDYGHMGAFQGAFRAEEVQYADKITYLTPKFNGFQAGISYSPEVDVKDTTTYFGMPAGVGGDDLEDLIEAGVRYDGEFSGVGVHASGAYTAADYDANAVLTNDDYKEWTAGLKFTWDAFGLGAGYNDRDAGLVGIDGIDTWNVGADYTWGAYTFGVSYLNSQGDLTGGGEDEYDRWTVGAAYTFGPGMKFNGSVGFHDSDLAGGAGSNDATVVAVGTDIQF